MVVTGWPRADLDAVDVLAEFGVATVHEATGRSGYLGTGIRPAWPGIRIGGTAVTALCWPGDNLMIHAAVEQCQPGDILVVTTTSPSTDGAFGELLATSLAHRGVRGLVTTGGVRDVAELQAMGFPVFSAAICAQGTVKATAGAVNVPVSIGGRIVAPRRRHDRDLRRQRVAAANAVDLQRMAAAHHRDQQPVALMGVGWQVPGHEVEAT